MDEKFIDYCIEGNLEEAKKLYSLEGVGIHADIDIEFAFLSSCSNDQMNVAQWLYSLGVDIHANNDHAFRSSCERCNINVAQWLYSLGGVDIHAENDDAFVWSCVYGHMNVAQWLYSLEGINIHALNDFAFIWSCRNGHMNIVQWLLSLDKFENKVVDEYLPEKLHEYVFQLGYLPIDKMKPAYEKYKAKIKEQVEEKRIDGPISLFEINGLVDLIVCYV